MRKILLKPNGIKLSTDKVIYLNRSVAVTDLNKINYNHDIKKIGIFQAKMLEMLKWVT